MNRAQKTVLGSMVIVLLSLAMLACVLFQFFVLKKAPEDFLSYFLTVVLILLGGVMLVWALRRQSPAEVETDERDKLIAGRAAMVFLVSAWIVFPVASVIPRFILGANGCIPAWSLPLINVGALIIIMMVYSIAVLVQYGRGGKDGGK
jgi:hypothetical protein